MGGQRRVSLPSQGVTRIIMGMDELIFPKGQPEDAPDTCNEAKGN
jgi:hypothetical protein